TEEFAQLAFARPEDVDALVESSHGEVAECLRIAWRFRSELAAQLANPGKIVEAPAPVQTTTTVPVPIASVPPPYVPRPNAPVPASADMAGTAVATHGIPAMANSGSASTGEAPSQAASGLQFSVGMIGGAVLLLFKFGAFFLKFAKVWLSMLLAIWAYSTVYGWPFATGFVLLIFVHEMGHVFAARWMGVPVSAPMFIPFMGALITLKENPRDAWSEAVMAYGGPLAGAIGATLCAVAGLAFNSPFLIALGLVTFVLNLFNMAPVPPLDGGRICAAVSTWFWFVGILVLGAGLFYFKGVSSIILILIILLRLSAYSGSILAYRRAAGSLL
ncbi:MAG TPA: site-2 protease family protein, partial [Candidatus Methylacidiphilales bacterium]|nr:site-2 protease family protein [Candidatus Methylacidiphilales bacterium]